MSAVRVLLARHGESVWNLEERYQGQGDSGLTPRGRDQAHRLAGWLVNAVGEVDRVISSDLPRARDTAAAYAARTGLDVELDARLREIDVGDWTGRPFLEVAAELPAVVGAAAEGLDVRRGGGETFMELRERVDAALAVAVSAVAGRGKNGHRPTVCVFTHGGPIRVAAAAAVGVEPPGHQAMASPTNCSLTVLDLGARPSRIVQYNAQIVPADRPSRAE